MVLQTGKTGKYFPIRRKYTKGIFRYIKPISGYVKCISGYNKPVFADKTEFHVKKTYKFGLYL